MIIIILVLDSSSSKAAWMTCKLFADNIWWHGVFQRRRDQRLQRINNALTDLATEEAVDLVRPRGPLRRPRRGPGDYYYDRATLLACRCERCTHKRKRDEEQGDQKKASGEQVNQEEAREEQVDQEKPNQEEAREEQVSQENANKEQGDQEKASREQVDQEKAREGQVNQEEAREEEATRKMRAKTRLARRR